MRYKKASGEGRCTTMDLPIMLTVVVFFLVQTRSNKGENLCRSVHIEMADFKFSMSEEMDSR